MEGLQNTNAQHQRNADLPLPVQLQGKQLCKWQYQHPEIHYDANSRIREGKRINIQTNALMFAVPSLPIEIDRPALEESEKNKYGECHSIEDYRCVNQTSDKSVGEESEVEEEDRDFDEAHLGEIEKLSCEKYLAYMSGIGQGTGQE